MPNLTTLLLKLPRNTEVTPEAAQTFLTALTQINPGSSGSILNILATTSNALPVALEIVHHESQVQFQLTCDAELVPFVETQIHSNYPLAVIEKIEDPVTKTDLTNHHAAYFKLKQGDYYPLTTYENFKEVDPISSILSILAKAPAENFILIQIAIETVNPSWQTNGKKFAEFGEKKEDGTYKPRPDTNIIKEKISAPGFLTSIRILSQTKAVLSDIVNTFEIYTRADGNSLVAAIPTKGKLKKEIEYIKSRKVADKQILNTVEIATLWHLPSAKIKTPSIAWGNTVLSEPPQNLPIATDKSPAEKSRINFLAKTDFQNKEVIFGIKDKDRLRHMWVVGKTGTGKSTMIANMAIDDVKKGRGIGIIDPHGDLCEDILDYIPSSRINDTIYFNPADREYPIALNPLEVTNREEAELVVAGLMSIFTKVWANVWSARMEYILRNSFLTLTEIPDSTLADVLKLLASQSYRNRVVSRLTDQALVHFWKNEFDLMPEKLQKEAIAPIQNKVGQFVTSPMIRRIIGTPKSSISIDEIMNKKKILLVNLSQGRLGEDNSALLGAMLITKFQLAAMHRVDTSKDERVPFYLYVDEFQNFATQSFVKILSEARKYKLSLLLANQYMAQIPDEVQKAILGNAGSMVSFSVGADDARVFNKEFAEVFTENDMVNLKNFQIAIKLMVDEHSTRPFLAKTLPLPKSKNDNREKVIKVSRERWSKAKKEPAPDSTSAPNTPNLPNVPNSPKGPKSPKHPKGQRGDLANRIIPTSTGFPSRQIPQQNPNTPLVQGEKDILSDKSPEIKEATPKRTNQTQNQSQVGTVPRQMPNAQNLPPNYPQSQTQSQIPRQTPPGQKTPYQGTPQYPQQGQPRPMPQQGVSQMPQPIPQSGQQPRPLPNQQAYPQPGQQPRPLPNQQTYPQPQQNLAQPRPLPPRPMPGPDGYPPQYPPPRPAFDEEADRKKREAAAKKDEASLTNLQDELAGLKKSD